MRTEIVAVAYCIDIQAGTATEYGNAIARTYILIGLCEQLLIAKNIERLACRKHINKMIWYLAVFVQILAGPDIHPAKNLTGVGRNDFGPFYRAQGLGHTRRTTLQQPQLRYRIDVTGKLDSISGLTRSRRSEHADEVRLSGNVIAQYLHGINHFGLREPGYERLGFCRHKRLNDKLLYKFSQIRFYGFPPGLPPGLCPGRNHPRSISRRMSFSLMVALLSNSFFPRARAIRSLAIPSSLM